MRRADRLFDILLSLRAASRPVTAATLAERLEVTTRTIYRDIAALQARRVPIEGEAGVGYILRRGFELPPLMFTIDEIDAIAVGVRLLRRLRDPGLQDAAASVLAKVTAVLPEALRAGVAAPAFFISDGSAIMPDGIDLSDVRRAIRENRKLRVSYTDAAGRQSHRTIWPVALAYYVDVTLLGAWCELREDFRNFRVDRIQASTMLDDRFDTEGGALMARWFALPREARLGG
jgi:predicted DNA-binding transcriptional regulator YafY